MRDVDLGRWFLKLFLAIGLVLIIPQYSNASEVVKMRENGPGLEMVILRAEDGLSFVDGYKIPQGKLQERVWSKDFQTYKDAQNYFNEFTKDWIATKDTSELIKDLVHTETPENVIWETRHQWDWEWERRYADWLQTEVTYSYLYDHNIPTDCADVAFTMRWIFSRINGLPAGNRLAGSNVVFTNESMRQSWRTIPTSPDWWRDQRFLEALEYVTMNTYTQSLGRDSYPVAINAETFIAGGWHLYLWGDGGHTLFVRDVNLNNSNPITIMASTIPRNVRRLWEEEYSAYDQPELGNGGMLRMRWPRKGSDGQWYLVSGTEMPNYSREQYTEDFMDGLANFSDAVIFRLTGNLDPGSLFYSRVDNLIYKIEKRIDIVYQGYEFCKENDCSPGSANYENWSTPHRDERILQTIQQIVALVTEHQEYLPVWMDYQSETTFYISDEYVYLDNIVANFQMNRMSYDPRDSIDFRWGGLIHIRPVQ